MKRIESTGKLIFWGATGQAVVLAEFLCPAQYQLVALFDNDLTVKSPFNNVPIHYGCKGLDNWLDKIENARLIHFAVAIAGDKGKDRVDIFDYLCSKGLKPITAVHANAFLASNAVVAPGCQILANAAVCARSRLGECVIVNHSANVDHDSVLGKGVHVAPGASLAGCVEIGDYSFIGTGAVILPRIKIGKNVIIGGGAVVTRNIPDNVVAYGNPARHKGDMKKFG